MTAAYARPRCTRLLRPRNPTSIGIPGAAAHGAHNAWTAVFVGLIPIIGLVAVGALIWAFARKRDGEEPG